MNGLVARASLGGTTELTISRLGRIRLSERALDICLSIGLFWGALAIRLPNLMTIPYFTDETVEVLQSLKIARGISFPLTNADPYYGAIYNYIVGGVFYIFGPSAFNARLAVTVLGALAVPLAYFLGKTLYDRLAGLLASAMMLTSAALILNGHVAWENNTTPFFATATMLALALAIERSSERWLIISGFLYGLTLQTHPGLIILAPGLLAYFIYSGLFPRASQRKAGGQRSLLSWLKSPWPFLTLIAAGIGYGNIIAQNVLKPAISWIAAQRHTYAFVAAPTWHTYATNLQSYVVMVLQMAVSSFDRRNVFGENFLLPLTVLSLALIVVGLVYSFRRGQTMPIAVLVMTSLILPYFNKSYAYPGATRYVSYLYPLVYLLIAAPLAHALRTESQKRNISTLYVSLLAIFLIVWPALSLWNNYLNAERLGNTNERVLSIDQELRQRYVAGAITEVIIDSRLSQIRMGGGDQVQRALDYLFTLDGTPHKSMVITVAKMKAELRGSQPKSLALVLTERDRQAIGAQMRLRAVKVTGPNPQKVNYGVFILDSSGAVSPAVLPAKRPAPIPPATYGSDSIASVAPVKRPAQAAPTPSPTSHTVLPKEVPTSQAILPQEVPTSQVALPKEVPTTNTSLFRENAIDVPLDNSPGLAREGEAVQLANQADGSYKAKAILLSREHQAAIPFDNAVLSWNADAPAGTRLEFDLRVGDGAPGTTNDSPWFTMGTWSASGGASVGGQSDPWGRVDVDTLELTAKATSFQYRVVLSTDNPAATPRLRSVSIVYADMTKPLFGPRPAVPLGWQRDLPVPQYSQLDQDPAVARDICSPTSLAMILNFWGKAQSVRQVYTGVRDAQAGIFGNWPFNAAYASTLGFDSYIDRFYSVEQLEDEIAKGQPVAISIKFQPGQLDNAPIASTTGHLIVVRGFTPQGNVIVNDPIAPTDASVRRVYKRDQLAKVWLDSGGVVYILKPR